MANKKEINYNNVPIEFDKELEMYTIFVADVKVLYTQTNKKTGVESEPSNITLKDIVMKKNTDNSSNVRRIARELPTNITPLKFIVEIKNTSGKGVSN